MAITEIYIGRIDKHKDNNGATPVTVYRIEDITTEEAEILTSEILCNPVSEKAFVNQFPANGHDTLEIGLIPGVMNPVEETLMNAAKDLGITPKAVGTSTLYVFDRKISKKKKLEIQNELLSQVKQVIEEKPSTLIVENKGGPVEIIEINNKNEKELLELSKERSLFLDSLEMATIQEYFQKVGRNPTDVELEILAQTWSEHCSHKTFKADIRTPNSQIKKPFIRRIIETSKKHSDKVGVVTAFKDNAGGIRFFEANGEMFVIIVKVETHNGPVALEPEGGSETKVGGDERDVVATGKGGELLFMIVMNNFGEPELDESFVMEGCLHPRKHLIGNTNGESSYGNKTGVPTLMNNPYFDNRFMARPTSMGGAFGIIREKDAQKGEPKVGQFVLNLGGKTGADGIHGATFSSGEMTADTKTDHATAVQMGNAIEQKKMFDAIKVLTEAHLIEVINDCGAGGFASAVGEMGEKIGVEIRLDKAPTKYPGLSPWQIAVSESQERMIIAAKPENWEEIKKICELYEVPVDVIGKFTGDGNFRLKYGDEIVGDLSMDFLHHGIPKRILDINYRKPREDNAIPEVPTNWNSSFEKVVSDLNVCSKEVVLSQYDKTVKGKTALITPDAAVVVPILGKDYAVVVSSVMNPGLTGTDAYEGTILVIAEAAVKNIAVGGNIKKAALVDNYVTPSPTELTLGDIDLGTDALCKMMDVLEIPVVSGKDSLSSTYRKKDGTKFDIPFTFNATFFSNISDVYKTVSPDFKSSSSIICWVGQVDLESLGGSIYFNTKGIKNSHLPKLDLEIFPRTLKTVSEAISSGKVMACKAVGMGGMGTSLAQMCFGRNCGATIDIGVMGSSRADFPFFNETPSFLVEVSNLDHAKELFGKVPYKILGMTMAEKKINVRNGIPTLFTSDVNELKKKWEEPMRRYFNG